MRNRFDGVGRTLYLGSACAWLLGLAIPVTWAQAGDCAGKRPVVPAEDAVRSGVEKIVLQHHGKVALYAVQLGAEGAAQRELAVDADKPVQTASVIKLGILYEAMIAVREGRARWDEPVVLKKGDAVPGSGILTLMDAPLTMTLKDALTLMVIVSDNTATNLMIDRFGIDAVNARTEWLGLKNTYLYKKVFQPAVGPMPADQPKFGLGKSTPREMAELMEDIGECRLRRDASGNLLPMDVEDKAVCGVALTMLKEQFYRETVPRYLETADATTEGVAIASKTGSLDAVRNDVAIVMGKSGPMVLSIFTYENQDHGYTVDNEGEVAIARLAKAIVNAWSPRGLDGRLLVPGLGLEFGFKPEAGCSAASGPGM